MGSATFDGTRLSDADSGEGTLWWELNPTKACTLEPDFRYQGSFSMSNQVKTSEGGVSYYDSGTTIDFTGQHILYKIWATNIGIMNNEGATGGKIFFGNGALSNYYEWYVVGADTYPITGGWLIIPIDPCVGGYIDATNGTAPSATAENYHGWASTFTGSSKVDNVAMDAIDYVARGRGLSLTGSSSVFDDFVTYDEGNSSNRFGVVSTLRGIIYVNGMLTIGSSVGGFELTTFEDSNQVIVFNNGRFATGSTGLRIDPSNASSVITFNSCTFIGAGRNNYLGSGEDTRPVLTMGSSAGEFNINDSSFQTFNDVSLNAITTVSDTVFVQNKTMYQNGATITGCTFQEPSTATGESYLKADNLNLVTDCFFISSSEGHAIEINTPGTYSFSGITHEGYDGSLGTNLTPNTGGLNAMVYNNSGGSVTLNLTPTSDTPTIRNAVDSSTTVSSSVTLTITVNNEAGNPIEGAQAYIDDDNITPFIMRTTTNASGVASTTWGGGAVAGASWRVRLYGYKPYSAIINISTADISVPVTLVADPQQS